MAQIQECQAVGTEPGSRQNKHHLNFSSPPKHTQPLHHARLRPYQLEAVQKLKSSIIAGNKRVMLQAPTGAGKTVLAGAITKGARDKGNKVLFVVPSISLVDQTVERFYAQGLTEVGVIQADHHLTNPNMPIQVASVQTLMRRRLPDVDVVVIDEAHHWFKFYAKWFKEWDAAPFIGLSATPWTRGLGKYYQDLIVATSTRELINWGYLSDFVVYGPSEPDLSGVKVVAGDYHEGQLSKVMSGKEIVADVVNTWIRLGENRPTLCYGVDRAHAKALQERFESQGINTGYIDAFTKREERSLIGRAFHTGDIQIVCNVGCLTTGIDWNVGCIVLARPTKSEMLFTQIIGRGLRTAPGKDYCLIMDHSNTHQNLGFVTDIHHETLCTGKVKKKSSQQTEKPLPKPCSQCTFMKPPKVHRCPQCGFAPERQNTVNVADGELVRITKTSARAKKEFYCMLRCYAAQHGYQSGWAWHKFTERFGLEPPSYRKLKIIAL